MFRANQVVRVAGLPAWAEKQYPHVLGRRAVIREILWTKPDEYAFRLRIWYPDKPDWMRPKAPGRSKVYYADFCFSSRVAHLESS